MRIALALLLGCVMGVAITGTVQKRNRAAATSSAPTAATRFVWGVSGHPFGQDSYRPSRGLSIAEQIALVRELGARWYRVDWDQKSVEPGQHDYDMLVNEAQKKKVRLLPILFASFAPDATDAQVEEAAFRYGRAMARRYRGRVTHWELSNERDIDTMIRQGEKTRDGQEWTGGAPDGDKPEHYEESRYKKVKAQILGLSRGVKEGDPNAKTMVDTAGWLHYGFFERLVNEDKVPFDILAWHWYSEMGDPTRVRGTINVIEKLRSFGKPIWITEINRRGGSQNSSEDAQAQYLSEAARQARDTWGVAGFFAYELLDEPYFGNDNPESYYGLVSVARAANGRLSLQARKPAFSALRSVITAPAAPAAR
jgi:hypothetical protein